MKTARDGRAAKPRKTRAGARSKEKNKILQWDL